MRVRSALTQQPQDSPLARSHLTDAVERAAFLDSVNVFSLIRLIVFSLIRLPTTKSRRVVLVQSLL